MFRIISRMVTLLVALTAIQLMPFDTAEAATRIVWVNSVTSSTWPVSYSVDVTDRQTGSDMRMGACRTGYKCIIIREKVIRNEWAAVTYGFGTNRVTIYLNPQRRWYSWYAKRGIVTHELGHANGIYYHSPYCTDLMYARVFCPNGSVPPYRWKSSDVRILQAN